MLQESWLGEVQFKNQSKYISIKEVPKLKEKINY